MTWRLGGLRAGPGHRRVDQGITGGDRADRIDQVGAANPLEDIPDRTGAHGVHHQLVLGVRRQHNDFDAGHLADDLLTGFNAGQTAGHANVHHDDIGLVRHSLSDSIQAAFGLGDDLKVWLLL